MGTITDVMGIIVVAYLVLRIIEAIECGAKDPYDKG